jgi:peptidyl-prolyl cis-trans isomerase D
VLTRFGYHLIKVDERKGDTIAVRHILVRIQQGDSSAAVSDHKADELSKAASADKPALFDSVTKALGITEGHAVATEGQELIWDGRYVPSVSAWAFTAKPGETSDLIDAEDAYYLARLDSLQEGGKPTLAAERENIRRLLINQKKLDRLVPKAQQIDQAVASGKTLEQAAKAEGLSVEKTPMFTRTMMVPGLGQANEAIGAAFGIPVGAVSKPVKTDDGVFVLQVDRRVAADRAAWEKQKQAQRAQVLQGLRQQRVQDFLTGLRDNAKIVDKRRQIEQQNRAASS